MPKTLISMAELEGLLLAEIRTNEGCAGVKNVGIYQVTDENADSNWSAAIVSCGNADPRTANRAAIYAQHKLRRHYDLLTDA